jgi:multisubunit Na+/H+ antiporter MnhB subunit
MAVDSGDLPLSTSAPAADPQRARLFAPTQTKLLVLGMTTGGFYLLLWMYRNWRALAAVRARPFSVGWRMAFWPLSMGPLVRALGRAGGGFGTGWAFASTLLFLLLAFASAMPNGWAVLAPLMALPLLPVNGRLRRARRDAGLPAQARDDMATWQWVWSAVFLAFWLLSLAAALLAMMMRMPPR